jgi:biotin operon repressor
MSNHWTFDRRAELVRLWQARTATGEIAHRLGTTKADIDAQVYHLRKRGVPLQRRNRVDPDYKALAKLAEAHTEWT